MEGAEIQERFNAFVALLVGVLGHARRATPCEHYLTGLVLPLERKSVEPMAARIDPGNVRQQHQSMHHFVADAPWSDNAVLKVCREYALPLLEEQGGIDALIFDDTGIPKKGTHSVGVGRQHCGQLGKVANCQVMVTLSLAGVAGSVPVAHRLYLPKKWIDDPERCRKAKVPEGIEFATKPELALAELDELIQAGVEIPRALGDATYGDPSEFRAALTDRALTYTLGITHTTLVWRPGEQALPPGPRGKYLRWDDEHEPIRADELALEHADDFVEVEWAEGTKGTLKSRFLALRVRPAQGDKKRTEPWPVEWLLIEWPESEEAPTRYWLSTEPEDTPLERLVYLAKLRWRIERDYQELKDEIGMDHYEGRSWRGLHHHVTLCVAAYVFLMAERLRLSPPADIAGLPLPPLPRGFKPRGASSTR